MSFLGIDIGSSQVKAAAFAEDGSVLASARCAYSYTVPEAGAMELDGNTVLSAALEVIKKCSNAVREISPVRAMACSSQGEAFSMLDEGGNILAPAMISGDIRPAAAVEKFLQTANKADLYRRTGQELSAMFSLAKLLYIRENQPELFRRAKKFLCFEDLLTCRLTGRAVMGSSLANRTMLYDLKNQCWDADITAMCGAAPEQLAEVAPAGTIIGKVLPSAAAQLGLEKDVYVVSGGHDQIMGAFGCGAVKPGMAMYAAGSVQAMVPVMDKLILSDELFESNLCTSNFAVQGMYCSIAYSLTGSNLTEYFIREIVQDKERNYKALYDSMPAAATDLLVLPYFTASGTPYFDANTPGCIYGMRFGTSRGELFKACCEGVAMEMRLNYELLRKNGFALECLIASGGGFQQSSAVQLHSDILGLPIALCNERETGCRGAASLSAWALTGEALPAPEILQVIECNKANHQIYNEKFAKWKVFSSQIRSLSKWQS